MDNRVFISFKNTKDGELTPDYYMAKDLYEALTENGIPTFWSGKTLIETGTDQYKEKIDHELDTCPILVVVGSSVENIASRWVKYEWDGFASDILNGKNNRIFAYVDGVDPHELPRSLRSFQCFDKKQTPMETVIECIKNALADIDGAESLAAAAPAEAAETAKPAVEKPAAGKPAVEKPVGKKLPLLALGIGLIALIVAIGMIVSGMNKKKAAADSASAQTQIATSEAAAEEPAAEPAVEEAAQEAAEDAATQEAVEEAAEEPAQDSEPVAEEPTAEEDSSAADSLDIRNSATMEVNGKRYKLIDSDGVTWKEADFWCKINGGRLALVKTEEDQKAIELLLQKGTAGYYYLGAEDASYPENEFHWSDGTLVSDGYTNWGEGCPDNSQINNEYEDYLAIINEDGLYGQKRFSWNDFRNDSVNGLRGFICEWEAD